MTEAQPPVIFVRVQVSHISSGGGALKFSGLLIFIESNLLLPQKTVEDCGIIEDGGEMAEGDVSSSGSESERSSAEQDERIKRVLTDCNSVEELTSVEEGSR